jgi:hypothetical protein
MLGRVPHGQVLEQEVEAGSNSEISSLYDLWACWLLPGRSVAESQRLAEPSETRDQHRGASGTGRDTLFVLAVLGLNFSLCIHSGDTAFKCVALMPQGAIPGATISLSPDKPHSRKASDLSFKKWTAFHVLRCHQSPQSALL